MGGLTVASFLGIFPVEGKLLQLGEGKMAEAIVPTHELGLIVGSGEVDVFSLFCRRPRVEGKILEDSLLPVVGSLKCFKGGGECAISKIPWRGKETKASHEVVR